MDPIRKECTRLTHHHLQVPAELMAPTQRLFYTCSGYWSSPDLPSCGDWAHPSCMGAALPRRLFPGKATGTKLKETHLALHWAKCWELGNAGQPAPFSPIWPIGARDSQGVELPIVPWHVSPSLTTRIVPLSLLTPSSSPTNWCRWMAFCRA